MNYAFRPIARWPRKPTADSLRRSSPFSSSYSRTLEQLERELERLDARAVVVQTGHQESHLRLDGRPRADAPRPAFPGVIVSFTTDKGAFSFPCDTFADWRANLRAIALTLEHLRAVDRYGVTREAEQYRGWKQLPASGGSEMTKDSAAAFIARYSDVVSEDILSSEAGLDRAFRQAARRVHPDAGGDHLLFVQLTNARDVVERHLPKKGA